jgi:hypothetical protein
VGREAAMPGEMIEMSGPAAGMMGLSGIPPPIEAKEAARETVIMMIT